MTPEIKTKVKQVLDEAMDATLNHYINLALRFEATDEARIEALYHCDALKQVDRQLRIKLDA